MIEIHGLTKRYEDKVAVDSLDFTVKPGVVTGFLGPNGAGKSTTMRMITGLDRPTKGTATVNGKNYQSFPAPAKEVGALLETKWVHPNRSARTHLKWMAQASGISTDRVDEVLRLVGLTDVASKKAGGFSLGMSQRLGLAGALLGDPETLILDEPVNGLDPEGIRWVRTFLKNLAAEGRTVFVSSHMLSEMALTADNLVVIGRGKLVADTTVEEFTSSRGGSSTRLRVGDHDHMAQALKQENITFTMDRDNVGREVFVVTGVSTDDVGKVAYSYGIPVLQLEEHHGSLEDAFLQLTGDDVEYQGAAAQGGQN
ncbi:ABC transporter ATP-binding protein [Corynebacterium pseudokroppenstedtii]|uniref:ABC transporter ATP-binding protein n=1 Tax=Corynebacterium pseudokroppenstedtii TaxID=2804917 RepID=A0AAU0PZA2_9CORY|nr:ABC transporter ATP-binding protein [Corynebacterium pseudokroppenstedtii]MBY0791424.1 ABC transporter ATP-binding protein [Corynebacterium pseudokroppenstedtii]MCF8703439.1 ABC transporter ATP-binding protein [Corynebacterium pseudokroppenstedtii]MCG2637027.1 ABC transporter ATP-binding protein [Corynebacterium pseudokroppenstedtii]